MLTKILIAGLALAGLSMTAAAQSQLPTKPGAANMIVIRQNQIAGFSARRTA